MRGRGADHDRRPFRPVRRELQSRRRMDFLRYGPAHRARHQHLPPRAAIRAAAQASAHNLDVLLDLIDSQITYRSRYLTGVALGAGARHGAARSVQSALGRLSGRRDRRSYRDFADPAPGRHARGAAAPVDAIARRTCDRRTPRRSRICAILGVEQRLMSARRGDRGPLLPARRASRARGKSHGSRVIYEVRHLTRYRYEAPVAANTCTLRLLPRSIDGQTVIDSRIDVTPHAEGLERARRHFRQSRRAHAHRDAASRIGRSRRARKSRSIARRRRRPA